MLGACAEEPGNTVISANVNIDCFYVLGDDTIGIEETAQIYIDNENTINAA